MRTFEKYITDETFNLDEGLFFENIEANGSMYRWERVGEDIVFTTDFFACPRIAYCVVENEFVFDLDRDKIQEFIRNHFPNDYIKNELEEPYNHWAKSVQGDYWYKHIQFIENWKKVTVHKDGTFEKESYPLQLFSTELKDAYDLLHNLLLKYKRLVKNYADKDLFIPTISGGLDTRVLSSLWKGVYQGDQFYLADIKNDGKNHIELSQADLGCALAVANTLGCPNHVGVRNGLKTLCGRYPCETFGPAYINNPEHLFAYIQHSTRWSAQLRPFADDLFLQIKLPSERVFRAVMLMLLAPELANLPLITTQKLFEKYNHSSYNFYEEYEDALPEAQNILDYWGKEKCKNILKEDEL